MSRRDRDELEDDDWEDEEEDREPYDHTLDPGFSSWDDYIRYKYF